jgi:predicted aconitase
VQLTDEERRVSNGEQGDLLAEVFAEQIAVGEFFGAERFVPVTNAHFMGDWEIFGQAGYDYLRRLADGRLRVRVPTTRNAQSVDFEHAETFAQACELVDGERLARAVLARLGVSTLNTCIGYQSVYQPRFGEHVAWGDTGTVAYANSVFGARTNYEGGTAGLAAALTGRTPAYGYHLDDLRRANVRVKVTATMRDLADWGALGALVGRRTRSYWNVPVLELDGQMPTSDELKHFGASLASFGSMAMYHVVGVTPEAPTFHSANRNRPLVDGFTVDDEAIEAIFAEDLPAGGDIDLVVFSGPQLSFFELKRIAEALDGKHVAPGVSLIMTTNGPMGRAAQEQGLLTTIREAGGIVAHGTCWYVMDPAAQRSHFGWRTLVTNSAKLTNIIRAHGYEPALRRTDDCLQVALTGRLEPR